MKINSILFMPATVLMETEIIFLSCSFNIQRFLQRFIDPSAKEEENIGLDLNEPLYLQRLEEVCYGSIV